VIDLHQHLWPEQLLAGLARRDEAPRLRRRGDRWELELAGEAPSEVLLADHDPVARALEAERDGLDMVAIAPSSPLGLEWLPRDEAQPLLDAYHDGILELGAPFKLWAAPALAAPAAGADEIDALLDRGALGACVPATALAGEAGRERLAFLLGRLQARDAALFVHPGPARSATGRGPAWWPALTSYVADMQAAWLAWIAWGRPAHPRLRVLFAMLAGGAPLQAERLAARGGPAGAVHDELAFFDVSSYGPKTVDAMLRVVGVDRLVHGSDRPVVAPTDLSGLGPSFAHAVAEVNPARLLSLDPVPA
jgi:hypothetical protein